MKQLDERSSTSKTVQKKPSNANDGNYRKKTIPPEQSLPLAQYVTATKMSGRPAEYSMATFYFTIASIILVMLGMIRYIHAKRRSHVMFRGKLRFL